jgi:hypothetical protein
MKYSVEQWIQRASRLHNNIYDYSLWLETPEQIKSSNRVPIICAKHGKFFQILDNHIRGKGCPTCAHINRSQSNKLSRDEYISKSVKVHGTKYDYSLLPQYPGDRNKNRILCPIHGEFKQSMGSHVRGNGCPKCAITSRASTIKKKYGVDSPRQVPIDKEALSKLQNRQWLYNEYVVNCNTMDEISSMLGVDAQTIANYLSKHQIDVNPMRGNSREENEIADLCLKHTEVIRNCRNIIPPKELDIYLPEYKIAIEYCGLYWHSEQAGKQRNYHADKLKRCNENGIRLITIYSDEWKERKTTVTQKLLSLMGKDSRTRVFARNTKVGTVDNKSRKAFFEQNHIQGNGAGSITIGLFDTHGVLVACATFSKDGNEYQLNRYATSCIVVGGFTKLIKNFLKRYPCRYLTTFADLRWSVGELYENSGWKKVKIIPPDYYYSLPGGKSRIHKFNFRRKYLPSILDNFNPNLSERENCDQNGILRIWDCGKIKYQLHSEQ